jgi:hypothetical protein
MILKIKWAERKQSRFPNGQLGKSPNLDGVIVGKRCHRWGCGVSLEIFADISGSYQSIARGAKDFLRLIPKYYANTDRKLAETV